jgi:endonuclease/exonuclease/phosphatase family metal-dependent hydrolase
MGTFAGEILRAVQVVAVMRLRILSYNIHKGFSLKRDFVLSQIRDAIRTTNADIVFLQEVLGHHDHPTHKIPEYASSAQFEFLADSVWTHFAYGRNAIYDEGHHGNAILSRYPIVSHFNTDISNHLLERRGLLDATIEIPSKGLARLACLHLDLTHRGRSQQLEKIVQWANSHPEHTPLIMAGDFNDWRNRFTQSLIERSRLQEVFMCLDGRCAKTFPSWFPVLSLDRIFVRGVEPTACETLSGNPWRDLSDHLPIVAELEI